MPSAEMRNHCDPIGHRSDGDSEQTRLNSLLSAKDFFVIAASYAMGCVTAGYYLVRLRTGQDIRKYGSGSVGARNVARRLGQFGFITTFLLDVVKGALAVGTARFFQLSEPGLALSVLAVVLGHVWPVQLKFKGGKGLSPALGALLLYDYVIVLAQLGVFLVVYAVTRSSLIGVVFAYAMTPVAGLAFGQSMCNVAVLSLLAVLVLFTHRMNLREEIRRRRE
jgi:glycerol-3-phosphate acyltransferase PlsY